MEKSNITSFKPKEIKGNIEQSSNVTSLSPREIVSELDRYVIGQNQAKRAVAIALRNRWRRQALTNEMKDEVIVAKHNIDENPNQPTKYGVRGIPTMLLFKGGELKATKVGATTKSNIVSWIKENI